MVGSARDSRVRIRYSTGWSLRGFAYLVTIHNGRRRQGGSYRDHLTTTPETGAGERPMRKDFLVFGSPLIEKEEIDEIVATLRSGWIGTGPRVARFEEHFKKYIGSAEAVAVSSCTAALHLAMLVSGVGPGDEVITTADAELAAKLKMYALHGLSMDAWRRFSDDGYKHYEARVPGFKYNMTDLQAALGLHQLARIGRNAARRQAIWARYDQAFETLPVVRPAPVEPGTVHGRHLYTILLKTEAIGKSRDEVLNELIRRNVGTGVHYTAVHLHHYYRQTFGFKPGDFPNAEWIGARTLSLPFSAKLSDQDVED